MSSDAQNLWHEFLDKCEFVYLTDHPMGVPYSWLESLNGFRPEDAAEAQLLDELREAPRDEFRAVFHRYLERQAEPSRIRAPKVELQLYLGDPVREQADALITAHDTGYVDRYILKAAGPDHERRMELHPPVQPEVLPPGELPIRHLIAIPRVDTSQARQLRKLCARALTLARQKEAQTVVLTHIPSVHPGLNDEFAAAEVVSAAREFLLSHPRMEIRLVIFGRRVYSHYRHWMEALGVIGRRKPAPAPPGRPPEETIPPQPPLEIPAALVADEPAPRVRPLAVVESLTRQLRKTPLGTLLRSPGPTLGRELAFSYEVRRALASFELGYHDQALSELQKAPAAALTEFLEAAIHWDRCLRTGDDAFRILARAVAARVRQTYELTPAGRAQVELLLGLSLESREDSQEHLRFAAELLADSDGPEAVELVSIATRLAQDEALNPHYRGTSAPDLPGDPVVIPLHLEWLDR